MNYLAISLALMAYLNQLNLSFHQLNATEQTLESKKKS